jgi:hypothetical protein
LVREEVRGTPHQIQPRPRFSRNVLTGLGGLGGEPARNPAERVEHPRPGADEQTDDVRRGAGATGVAANRRSGAILGRSIRDRGKLHRKPCQHTIECRPAPGHADPREPSRFRPAPAFAKETPQTLGANKSAARAARDAGPRCVPGEPPNAFWDCLRVFETVTADQRWRVRWSGSFREPEVAPTPGHCAERRERSRSNSDALGR